MKERRGEVSGREDDRTSGICDVKQKAGWDDCEC